MYICIYGLPKTHSDLLLAVKLILQQHFHPPRQRPSSPRGEHTPSQNSTGFRNKVQELTLDPDEIKVSFGVVSLFTCIFVTEAVETTQSTQTHAFPCKSTWITAVYSKHKRSDEARIAEVQRVSRGFGAFSSIWN